MTVLAAITRNDITATANQKIFTYTFRVIAATDMSVYKNGVLLSSGYQVNNVNNVSGGTVELDVGATAGQVISFVLAMPLSRATNYQNSGDFLALDVNGDFDALWLALQQSKTDSQGTVRRPIADSGTINMELPVAGDRANKMLTFDSDGAVKTESYLNNDLIVLEVITAIGDGTTTVFPLLSTSTPTLLQISIDGLLQEVSSYNTGVKSVIFYEAPYINSKIEIRAFLEKEISASTDLTKDNFSGNGTNKVFTLSAPSLLQNTFVYIDGIYQYKSNYSVVNTTLTFITAPPYLSDIEAVSSRYTPTVLPVVQDDSVGSLQLKSKSVTQDKIADNAVGADQIANNAIGSDQVANNAIGANQIASVPISVGITSVVTATSITATVNTHVYVSAATQTITLPVAPTLGQRVLITVGNFADTVIGKNGSKIMSLAEDITLDKAYLSIEFIFTDATQGWLLT